MQLRSDEITDALDIKYFHQNEQVITYHLEYMQQPILTKRYKTYNPIL